MAYQAPDIQLCAQGSGRGEVVDSVHSTKCL